MVASTCYRQIYDSDGCRRFGAPLVESLPRGVVCEDAVDYLAQQTTAQKNSAPYQRSTYWAERISQWRGREPAIDPDDFKRMQEEYWRLCGGRWGSLTQEGGGIWEKGHILTKDDTRFMLWNLDKSEDLGTAPYFVKKYLVQCLCYLVSVFHGVNDAWGVVFACCVFAIKVADGSLHVGAHVLPHQVIQVDASCMPADVAGFIVLLLRQTPRL